MIEDRKMIRVNSLIKSSFKSFKLTKKQFKKVCFLKMQNTPEQLQQLKEITSTEIITPIKLAESKQQQSKPQTQKHYYFQTQTKRLKEYYSRLQNQQKIISRRILFNNSPGIVRYIGELKHQGAQKDNIVWLGVQWEQSGRGKHNGTVKGHKYFECAANQGSMVKYEKIEFGYRLQTALFKRYFRSEQMHHAKNIYEELRLFKKELNLKDQSQPQLQAETTQSKTQEDITQNTEEITQNTEGITQSTEGKLEEKVQKKRKLHKIEYDSEAYFDSLKKTKKIMVEFVGFDQIWTKINNLDKIQSISLPESRICDLGPKGHLNDLLKNIKILSLEDNLLSHYNQIYQLGHQLPYLQELSLTNNRLAEPELPFEEMKSIDLIGYNSSIEITQNQPIFQKLKTLVLINTGLKWKTLFKILPAFNRLTELVLCKNNLTDYQNIDINKFHYLEELIFFNLEDINLLDFKNLMCFKDLPKLEKLTINKNPIAEFGRQITGFQKLKQLSVQGCQVRNAVVIYELSNFKNIENLNIKHNPLNELVGNAHVRLRSIAEFQKLTIINGAPLKKYERKDSQIYYMRETFREYFTLKNRPDYDYDFEDFLKWCEQLHPNIQLFIKRFGNPYEVQKKKEIKDLIKNQVFQTQMKKGTGMIKVKIFFEELQSSDYKKIPMTWTLANLKNFLSKTTKIPAGQQILRHKNEDDKIDEEMTEDHKPLSFYSITPLSTLVIKRKDAKGGISFIV